MTTTDLDDRLLRLGDHLDAERQAHLHRSPAASSRTLSAEHPNRRPPIGVRLVGAALLLGGVVALIAVVAQRRPATVEVATGSACDAPAPAAAGLGSSRSTTPLPAIVEPPAWFGSPRPAQRQGGQRQGRWTSTAVGLASNDSILQPMWIAATDGSLAGLDQATPVEVRGTSYRVLSYGALHIVATTTEPLRLVSGTADITTLAGLLNETSAFVDSNGIILEVGEIPPGFCQLLQPQRHATDAADRRTLASENGGTVINEISDWAHPALAAAATGADLRRVSSGQVEAWTGVTVASTTPLRFLTWSPSPGTVFEITTYDLDRPLDDLLDLASRTTALPPDQWQARYGTR